MKDLRLGSVASCRDEIRRANAVTPLTAIHNEYFMAERMFEKDVIPTCEEMGIGFVPFSTLTSGFLSGKYTQNSKFVGDDVRHANIRYQKENVEVNQPLLDLLNQFEVQNDAIIAQIFLAWMLYKKVFIVPILGMCEVERFEKNFGTCDVVLSEEEYNEIESINPYIMLLLVYFC